MLYVNMMANNKPLNIESSAIYKDLLQPKQIGTFLHHAIVDAIWSNASDNVEVMLKNLERLFTENGKDLLMMTKFLGINDFSNLDLLDPIELVNDYFDLRNISKCYSGLTTKNKEEQEFDKTKSRPYMSPSPCDDVSTYPDCMVYCGWQQKVFDDWNTLKIDTLLRCDLLSIHVVIQIEIILIIVS